MAANGVLKPSSSSASCKTVECISLSSDSDEDFVLKKNNNRPTVLISCKQVTCGGCDIEETKDDIDKKESKDSILNRLGLTKLRDITTTVTACRTQNDNCQTNNNLIGSCTVVNSFCPEVTCTVINPSSQDFVTEKSSIKIVEAHSLAPNLWLESDMAKPSTSACNEDDPLIHLNSFLKDYSQYADPKDMESVEKVINNLKKKGACCPEEYLKSYEFIELIDFQLIQVRKNPKNFYVYLKNIADELNYYEKSKDSNFKNGKTEENMVNYQSRIEKLHRILAKLDKRIKKCQAKELSLDDMDEDDSHFIYEQKLKQKFMDTYNLLCKLEDRSNSTGRVVHSKLAYDGSRFPEINRKIRKLINKGRGNYFPDFRDIFNIVKSSSSESQLNLTDSYMFELAQEIFEDVGKELQKRRQKDLLETLSGFLPDVEDEEDFDPAKNNPDLKEKLEKNDEISKTNMNEVITKFSEKQLMLKLEPKEVNDEEAELSPSLEENGDESEEEESNNGSEITLTNILESDDEGQSDSNISLPNIEKEDMSSSCDKININKRKAANDSANVLQHEAKRQNLKQSINCTDNDNEDVIILE